MTRMYNPPHPGEVLREYLGGVSISKAAVELGVHPATLGRVVECASPVSAEMANRLASMFETSPQLWTGIQSQYDLHLTGRNKPSQSDSRWIDRG